MGLNINNVLASAQQLMLDQGYWDKVDAAASVRNGKKVVSHESRMNEDTKPVQVLQYDNSAQQQRMADKMKNNPIFESFAKTPPMSEYVGVGEQYAGEIPESFLSGLGGIGLSKPVQQPQQMQAPRQVQQPRQQINEMAYTQAQPMQQPVIGGIDYNYIKYLIDESIKAHMSNTLNESAGSLAGLKMLPGNKIQFMDNKGNIFEGTLTLKKRAAQK